LLQADLATGTLRQSEGSRCAALSLDFVQHLHFTLLDQFSDAAQDVLYRAGYEWGLQTMLQANQRHGAKPGAPDFWQLPPAGVFESWWQPLREGGWGAVTLDLSRLPRHVIVAELQNSAVAAALEGTDQPVCHYYAGLLAGGASYFRRAELHAVEIECRAMGHPSCRFIIGSGADIDAAEGARQQGTAAAEIVRRLG
jgi:predicted hydrocarbon binding protein